MLLDYCLLLIIVADDCRRPLGMEDHIIANDQITASSEWSPGLGATNARLNQHGHMSRAWSVGEGDTNPWIQVNLMIPTWVAGVKIQGRQDHPQWVTQYKVDYSSNGQNWLLVQSNDDEDMVSLSHTGFSCHVHAWIGHEQCRNWAGTYYISVGIQKGEKQANIPKFHAFWLGKSVVF